MDRHTYNLANLFLQDYWSSRERMYSKQICYGYENGEGKIRRPNWKMKKIKKQYLNYTTKDIGDNFYKRL